MEIIYAVLHSQHIGRLLLNVYAAGWPTQKQEVARILRSLPIIGPWTNKPSGTADTGGGEECGGYGRFREEAFVVAPSDLLAFDEVSMWSYLSVVDMYTRKKVQV